MINRKKYLLIFSLIVICQTSVMAQQINSSPWQGASFSATLVSFHQSKPQITQKGKIFISEKGIRQESLPNKGSNKNHVDTIFDIRKMKSYMVNKTKGTYFEVPVQQDDENNSLPGGLFTNKPCQGFEKSIKVSKKKYLEREVTEWRCESQKYSVTQYYDNQLKSVIREQHENGSIEELRDISVREIPDKYYEIPKKYKKISMQEFFTGVPVFEQYKETGREGDIEEAKDPNKLPGYTKK